MPSLATQGVVVKKQALERWLRVEVREMGDAEIQQRGQVIAASAVLGTIYLMRDELAALWQRSAASKEQLVQSLENWCRRAEATDIGALHGFCTQLRSYRSVPGR
jgi:stearoyl-CoA desaturase (delta-9 desaturase)